jgi:hypothetical protein
MARFRGVVGYGESAETSPGVFEESITTRTYSGDVIRDARNLQEREQVLDDISVQNSISIVADPYANEHFHAIRYVEWAGSLWKVTSVEVQRPRLLLRLGGIYNGPTD